MEGLQGEAKTGAHVQGFNSCLYLSDSDDIVVDYAILEL